MVRIRVRREGRERMRKKLAAVEVKFPRSRSCHWTTIRQAQLSEERHSQQKRGNYY